MTAPLASLAGMLRLLQVMARLRDPLHGCAWDRAQDHRSLARYTLEEAHEFVAAVEAGDLAALRDELGDLLFQVVFHAQLAAERGDFNLDEVAAGMADKLWHRHPHVFGSETARTGRWEQLKAAERATRGAKSQLDDLPLALPALQRAVKLGQRAAAVGFDWPDATGARAKVLEELSEIDAARAVADAAAIEAEMGDLLLAATSLARHLDVDPETALRKANRRFEARFRALEGRAREAGRNLQDFSPAELDALWETVKSSVQS